jgi:DNA-binding CsgD family transcriptional regulator/PAS domain-containing protein
MVDAWIRQSLREGDPIALEFRILRTDGQDRRIHGSAMRQRTLQNAPAAVRIVLQDITDRKHAEEAALKGGTEEPLYHEVERLGHIGTWHYETASRRLRWSEGMYALLGRDRAQGPPTLIEMQGLAGNPPSPVVDALFGALKRGERMERELTIQLQENDERRLHCTIHAGYDGEGTLTCLYGIVQDVPSQSQPLPSAGPSSTVLTSRELAVCQLIRDGLSSKEIATRLAISAKSVQTHRNHIRRKLGLLNQSVNLAGYLKTHTQA